MKTVFITGATSGIGKACAQKFAEKKYNLIVTGRRAEILEDLARELAANHPIQVLPLCLDVQDKKTVFEKINQLPQQWQAVDILINNAGLALGRDPFDEADIADWETMMQTNVNGMLYVTRALLPLLKNSTAPHIINMGSTAGKEVYENGNVYCASKFAVGALSQAMRIDLLKHGIKVTAVHPGAAETAFSKVRFKGDEQKAASVYEHITPLSGSDIAETIFYCASLPKHVCINELVITCLQQANSFYTFKNKA